MAIEVNLEKYGHKKKGFLGFSWCTDPKKLDKLI